jgi:hypothetical protein
MAGMWKRIAEGTRQKMGVEEEHGRGRFKVTGSVARWSSRGSPRPRPKGGYLLPANAAWSACGTWWLCADRETATLASHSVACCPLCACTLLQPVPNVRNPAMMLEAEDFAKVMLKYKNALRFYAAKIDSTSP